MIFWYDEICAKVKISKVTLFKYFPHEGRHTTVLLQVMVPEESR